MKMQKFVAWRPKTENGQGFAKQVPVDLVPRAATSAFNVFFFGVVIVFLLFGLLVFIHNIGFVENRGRFGCETYLNQSNITVCS